MTPFIFLLPLSGVTAFLNRYWRGEGAVSRLAWYSAMDALGFAVSLDPAFAAIWLLFLLGYAMAPWQAMFSAVTGKPPGREDGRAWQWMQALARMINRALPVTQTLDRYWRTFGMIYGAIRASLMLPAVFALAWHQQSYAPLAGVGFLLMGCVYFWSYKIARHLQLSADKSIFIAEVIMGWAIGTYLLVCSYSKGNL